VEGAAVAEAEVEAARVVELAEGVVTAELVTVLRVVAEEEALLLELLLEALVEETTLVLEAEELDKEEETAEVVVTGALVLEAGALEDEAEAEEVAVPDPAWNCSL
jgi:aspartate/tyrosine/aromatic aminotransferase